MIIKLDWSEHPTPIGVKFAYAMVIKRFVKKRRFPRACSLRDGDILGPWVLAAKLAPKLEPQASERARRERLLTIAARRVRARLQARLALAKAALAQAKASGVLGPKAAAEAPHDDIE